MASCKLRFGISVWIPVCENRDESFQCGPQKSKTQDSKQNCISNLLDLLHYTKESSRHVKIYVQFSCYHPENKILEQENGLVNGRYINFSNFRMALFVRLQQYHYRKVFPFPTYWTRDIRNGGFKQISCHPLNSCWFLSSFIFSFLFFLTFFLLYLRVLGSMWIQRSNVWFPIEVYSLFQLRLVRNKNRRWEGLKI